MQFEIHELIRESIMERAEIQAAAERLRRLYAGVPYRDVYGEHSEQGWLDLQKRDEDLLVGAFLAEHRADDGEPKFYLQNEDQGYLGNSPMFWREGGHGYTQWLDEAQLFTEAEADKVIRGASSHRLRKWPRAVIDQHSQRSVDIQRLPLTERTTQ